MAQGEVKWAVVFVKAFLKDLARLPADVRGRVIQFVDEELPQASDPF